MPARLYYKETRFEHFRTFCQVARLGSFAAAGQALGLSRPTVWQQIDALEREWKVKLFVRAGRRVEPTEEGRLLLELVQPSVAAMDSLPEAFQARLADRGGVLRIATVQGNELHAAINRFRDGFARVHLALVERRSIDVVKLVEDGACDLGFAMSSPAMPRSALVHYEPVGKRSFMLIAPAKHPLIQKRRLRLVDLAKYPLVTFPTDNPLRQHVERAFERAGLEQSLQVSVETDSPDTVEQCVALGIGVAIGLPAPGRTPTAPVVFRSLAEHFGSLPLYVLWKRGAHLLPHAAAFVELVKESLGK